jgi:plasmid stabilization system protein ParE
MKQRKVVFSPEAIDDLNQLYDWIASVAGVAVAFSVDAGIVTIYRLFHGGQNWEEVLA